MAANTGSQTVTILYHSKVNNTLVNRRFVNIRETGIYSGGYLSVVDNSHASLSTLICEITDGTYQVKITTGEAVVIAVAQATPYVVLRWSYTGSETDDYMSILAVATPATNDLIVAECTFTGGGNLQGADYSERSTPNTQDLFLKVEPTEDTELRVRVRAGRVYTPTGFVNVPDQKSSLFTVPTSNSRIDLLYINTTTGAVSIAQGTAGITPVAPSYAGKLVIAEITLTSTSTNITSSMINDTRTFISPYTTLFAPDDITLESSGSTLQIKNASSRLLHAWADINNVLLSSYGISAITKLGTGHFRITWSTPFSTDYYCVHITPWITSTEVVVADIVGQSKNYVEIKTYKDFETAIEADVRFSISAIGT